MTTQILFFLFVLFSPTQLGKHWWPGWSLVNGVRVDYLSPTLYVTDLFLILLFVAIIVSSLRGSASQRRRGNLASKTDRHGHGRHGLAMTFRTGFFLLASYLLFLIFLSPNPLLALYWLLRYLEIPLVAYLVFVLGKNVRAIIPTALSLGVLFSVTLGFTQMAIGKTTGLFWIVGERSFTISTPGISTISLFGQTVLRPYATFPHPNAFAGWLALSLLLVPKKIFRGIAFLGVLLSVSRAAIVSTIAAVIFSSVFSLSLSPIFFSRFSFISFPQESIRERALLQNTALQMLYDHPLFGVGPGHFITELPKYLPPGTWILQPVHNVFLLLLSEFGVIGTIIGLMCLIRLIRLIRPTQPPKQWLPILIVLLGTGLADHYWITAQQNRLLLGIIGGLFFAELKKR